METSKIGWSPSWYQQVIDRVSLFPQFSFNRDSLGIHYHSYYCLQVLPSTNERRVPFVQLSTNKILQSFINFVALRNNLALERSVQSQKEIGLLLHNFHLNISVKIWVDCLEEWDFSGKISFLLTELRLFSYWRLEAQWYHFCTSWSRINYYLFGHSTKQQRISFL